MSPSPARPLAPVININCAGGADPGSLPAFSQATDQYLAREVAPFLSIPLWVWIAAAGGAFWYFYGRKHWAEWMNG